MFRHPDSPEDISVVGEKRIKMSAKYNNKTNYSSSRDNVSCLDEFPNHHSVNETVRMIWQQFKTNKTVGNRIISFCLVTRSPRNFGNYSKDKTINDQSEFLLFSRERLRPITSPNLLRILLRSHAGHYTITMQWSEGSLISQHLLSSIADLRSKSTEFYQHFPWLKYFCNVSDIISSLTAIIGLWWQKTRARHHTIIALFIVEPHFIMYHWCYKTSFNIAAAISSKFSKE